MKLKSKSLQLLLIGASVLTISGCASIISDSSYPVAISTTPDNASFKIYNASGIAVHGGTTPATVQLKASSGFFKKEYYKIVFEIDGKKTEHMLRASIDGWYFANLIFGGLIGMLIIDPATGAMWSLPDNVNRHLDDGLTIKTIESLTDQEIAMLIPITDQTTQQ